MSLSKDPEKGQETAGVITSSSESSRSSNSNDRDVEKGESQKATPSTVKEPVDPNIVDWDGDDDPEKPINWPNKKKWRNIFVVSALTLLTPFGSTMFAPAVPDTMRTFHSDNIDLASFVVSVYVLGYAFGPLIIAPMSELYGRLWVYHVNTALFIIFNIGCALSTSLSMEIVFRFLAGFAGVTPLTVGSGTISDLFKQEERGRVMSLWTLPVLLGPTLGPVAGSYLAEAAGWRWTFWCLAILASRPPLAQESN
jgi:multidrug resistance protein